MQLFGLVNVLLQEDATTNHDNTGIKV